MQLGNARGADAEGRVALGISGERVEDCVGELGADFVKPPALTKTLLQTQPVLFAN